MEKIMPNTKRGFGGVGIIIIILIILGGGAYLWGQKSQKFQLISPNGGEVWSVGSTQVVKWISDDKGLVFISLTTYSANQSCRNEGGEVCPQDISRIITIADNVPGTGSYSWVVNDNLGLGRYWLSVCVLDSNVCDKSDETFTIK